MARTVGAKNKPGHAQEDLGKSEEDQRTHVRETLMCFIA